MSEIKGKALVFSAPSGSGKTTIVKQLLQRNANMSFSISACTRAPRDKMEQSGKDYYFMSEGEFLQKIDNNDFVEWEQVYPGKFYGTLKSEVERVWSEGKVIVFDVDVVGGLNLKKYFGDAALAIFIRVPSLEILETRLRDRQSESKGDLDERIRKAASEFKYETEFDVVVVNDTLPEAVAKTQRLIDEFLADDKNLGKFSATKSSYE